MIVKTPVVFVGAYMLLRVNVVVTYHLASFALTHHSSFFLFLSFVLRVLDARGNMGFEGTVMNDLLKYPGEVSGSGLTIPS